MIPELLARIKLCNSRTPLDRKADMEDHVKTPLRRFQPLINEIFERFKTAVRDEVLKPIKEQETDWITTAADRCNEWQGEFKTGAFLGIMNRDGRRKAFKGKDEVNLSAELIHIKSRKLCSLFNSTHKDHLRLVSDLEDDMDTLCTTMITEMQGKFISSTFARKANKWL